MIPAALPIAGLSISFIAKAIVTLYDATEDVNSWMDKHIKDMQASDKITISRTGKVLEGAKFGFGIGYIAPVTIIAVGQFLLGNTFAAIATVLTAPVNPLAMTCAAVGAIYYGWGALTDDERADALDKLSKGLEIGIELIKSIIRYVTKSLLELMSTKHIQELKEQIQVIAGKFGKTLFDVTRNVTDKIIEMWDRIPNPRDMFDINGDGKLDMKDLKDIPKVILGDKKKEVPSLPGISIDDGDQK